MRSARYCTAVIDVEMLTYHALVWLQASLPSATAALSAGTIACAVLTVLQSMGAQVMHAEIAQVCTSA